MLAGDFRNVKLLCSPVVKSSPYFMFTFLPARASEQGKVIGVGVHIYICVAKKKIGIIL